MKMKEAALGMFCGAWAVTRGARASHHHHLAKAIDSGQRIHHSLLSATIGGHIQFNNRSNDAKTMSLQQRQQQKRDGNELQCDDALCPVGFHHVSGATIRGYGDCPQRRIIFHHNCRATGNSRRAFVSNQSFNTLLFSLGPTAPQTTAVERDGLCAATAGFTAGAGWWRLSLPPLLRRTARLSPSPAPRCVVRHYSIGPYSGGVGGGSGGPSCAGGSNFPQKNTPRMSGSDGASVVAESAAVIPRPRGYHLFSSLRCVPSADSIDVGCYTVLTCRGSGPGGQGANSSSSKVEVRVDLGMLGLYLEEVIASGAAGDVREVPLCHSTNTNRDLFGSKGSEYRCSGDSDCGEAAAAEDSGVGEERDEFEESDGDDDAFEAEEPGASVSSSTYSSALAPSRVSISYTAKHSDPFAFRNIDTVVTDPEAYLLGLAAHDRIVEKIREKLPMLLRHGGCGTAGIGAHASSSPSLGGTAPNAQVHHQRAHQHSFSSFSSGGSSLEHGDANLPHRSCIGAGGPAAVLADGATVLLLTCNQHRSNRQNMSECLGRLREIIFEASYVMPTESARTKSFRASHHSVSKAKLKRQANSNRRRAHQQVKKGLW